jgi:hypothetical protein
MISDHTTSPIDSDLGFQLEASGDFVDLGVPKLYVGGRDIGLLRGHHRR